VHGDGTSGARRHLDDPLELIERERRAEPAAEPELKSA
jgi:hypothetical protein